jgi:hypothetical protein
MTQTQTQPAERRGMRETRSSFRMVGSTEARPGIMTSEMWLAVVSAAVFIIAAYVSDTFDNDLGWILGASMIGAYILSRGFAKSGSREGPFFVSGEMPNRGNER